MPDFSITKIFPLFNLTAEGKVNSKEEIIVII